MFSTIFFFFLQIVQLLPSIIPYKVHFNFTKFNRFSINGILARDCRVPQTSWATQTIRTFDGVVSSGIHTAEGTVYMYLYIYTIYIHRTEHSESCLIDRPPRQTFNNCSGENMRPSNKTCNNTK